MFADSVQGLALIVRNILSNLTFDFDYDSVGMVRDFFIWPSLITWERTRVRASSSVFLLRAGAHFIIF